MRPLGPRHAQDPSAREGSHLGSFEEMDGIEWMVSPVVLVHERCVCACPKDVDGKVGLWNPYSGARDESDPVTKEGRTSVRCGMPCSGVESVVLARKLLPVTWIPD